MRVGRLDATAITRELAAKRREFKFVEQGGLMVTGVEIDLAIDGPGFFLLRDPVANRLYASRAAVFERDDEDAEGFIAIGIIGRRRGGGGWVRRGRR